MGAGLKKPVNLLLSGTSYIQSVISGQPVVYGLPPAIGVELTNNCNLRCPECVNGSGLMTREKGFMDIELYHKLIAEMNPYLFYISLYFQGESLMHPLFPSFISASGSARTIISTNGYFLTEENCIRLLQSSLSTLIISIDGPDQDSYSVYRSGGKLSSVKEGISRLVTLRKTIRSGLKIEVQMLMNRFNEDKVSRVEELCRSMNLPLRLKSMQIITGTDYEKWLPSSPEFRRYEKSGDRYQLKNKLPGRCARLWFNPVITWDGNVLPCCFDKNGDHVMGNLYQESFADIWSGSKYRLFRRMLMTDRRSIDICNNCTSGMKNVM
jgi:radical SAM protein with 4Fe4S-binding SPASM domain